MVRVAIPEGEYEEGERWQLSSPTSYMHLAQISCYLAQVINVLVFEKSECVSLHSVQICMCIFASLDGQSCSGATPGIYTDLVFVSRRKPRVIFKNHH